MGISVTTSAGNSNLRIIRSQRALAALMPLEVTRSPGKWVVLGDSTGNESDEWAYRTAQALASIFPYHTHKYKSWNDTTQQYDESSVLALGSGGLRRVVTGAATTSMRMEIDNGSYPAITGDITVIVKMDFHGNALTTFGDIGGKMNTSPNRSWRLMTGLVNGKLTFGWSADGTSEITKNSTIQAPAEVYNNGPVFIKASLDVDNGAGGNDVKFFYSYDKVTWEPIGGTVTTASVTSIATTTAKTQFIGRGGSTFQQMPVNYSFYEMQVYASLDGTNKVVDIDVGALPARATGGATTSTFHDDVGNLVTATHNDNSSIVGAPRFLMANGSHPGSNLGYYYDGTRYPKLISGNADAAIISHSHNHGGNVTTFIDAYKTLTDLLQATNPYMPILCTLQNPRFAPATAIEEHALRMKQITQFATAKGFDLIDAFSNFSSNHVDTDGVHPTVSGGIEWNRRVMKYLGLQAQ
jgi:lysophospholipase L1-like esterase